MTSAYKGLPLNGVNKIAPWQQMVSSSTGAFLTSIMMTPLDVVKIRLQSQAKPSAFTQGHCFLYCNGLMDHVCGCVNGITQSSQWYKRPGHFNGTIDAFVKIARYEGVTSLWSGLPPTLVMAIPATVVYFTCYEQLKGLFGYRDDAPSSKWIPMAAGSLARVWAASLISPIELIRTKVQSESYSYSQVWKAVQEMIRVKGILSLWRGLGPTLLRDVPFSGVYWASYEAMKAHVLRTRGNCNLKFLESFAVGAAAGSIAAVLTLPFDVIKTRRQIQLGEAEILGKKRDISSTWRMIHKIYTEEGFRALYTGLLPRLIKVAPSCAIMISTYEFFKYFFLNQNLAKLNIEAYSSAEEHQSVTQTTNTSLARPMSFVPEKMASFSLPRPELVSKNFMPEDSRTLSSKDAETSSTLFVAKPMANKSNTENDVS